jgi:hypothetical protein
MGFSPRNFITPSPSTEQAPPDYTKEDKWKLASQLQKSIRHGHVDMARRAAVDLANIEPAYLRYRMAVIAVEDVGAGAPDVVIDAFGGGWKKADVERRGGVPFLAETAALWASSVKDRTPCDFLSCTRWLASFEQRHGSWVDVGSTPALRLAMDSTLSWWERGLAAWRFAGTDRFPSAHLPLVAGEWDGWVDACSQEYGDEAAQLMRLGQAQREPHPVFVGMSLGARLASNPPAIVENPPIPSLPNVGPWLSAALDKHTSEGRQAINRLLDTTRSFSPLEARGVSREAQQDLVGRLWFWLEGGRCDRQWLYALPQAIRNDTRQQVIISHGVAATEVLDSWGDTSQWQRARQSALGLRNATPHRPR